MDGSATRSGSRSESAQHGRGYDIIGDVHGCAEPLERLLRDLGHRADEASCTYAHPERQAVFVGDLVDRGRDQLRVLQIVKGMVDTGSAQVVMGNHEFNAIAYHTKRPDRPDEFLRKHSEKNTKQHQAFLDQVSDEARTTYLEWFMTFPLWLDLGGVRVVHACWHEPSMQIVKDALSGNRFPTVDHLVRASDKEDPLYAAVEVLLKGPELDLRVHGLKPYVDKDGHARGHARVAWWRDDATTVRDLTLIDPGFRSHDGEPYPTLPDKEVSDIERSYSYRDVVPVLYGHYWRSGRPQPGRDYTARTGCVDFSAVNTGTLVAYRWDGETEIRLDNYVGVDDDSPDHP